MGLSLPVGGPMLAGVEGRRRGGGAGARHTQGERPHVHGRFRSLKEGKGISSTAYGMRKSTLPASRDRRYAATGQICGACGKQPEQTPKEFVCDAVTQPNPYATSTQRRATVFSQDKSHLGLAHHKRVQSGELNSLISLSPQHLQRMHTHINHGQLQHIVL